MNHLKALREGAGLSRSELGVLLGVSGSQLGYWERSELVPAPQYLARLAEVLGVSAERLGEGLRVSREAFERQAEAKASQGAVPHPEHDD